jgi:hypothetical protein
MTAGYWSNADVTAADVAPTQIRVCSNSASEQDQLGGDNGRVPTPLVPASPDVDLTRAQ